MSRIGKKQIIIPAQTEVTVAEGVITVKGPKGTLTRAYNPAYVSIVVEGEEVKTEALHDNVHAKALWGTYSSHIMNMIQGVNTPFEKKLIIEGVGFRSEVKGSNLEMALGFSHPVVMAIPEDITLTAEKNNLTISGINKESVGQFAAEIRAQKKPEPYKGKGIRYADEIIRRKEGKKTV